MLNMVLFSFLFDWYDKMVSPQNGDTRGGRPPLAMPLLRTKRISMNRKITLVLNVKLRVYVDLLMYTFVYFQALIMFSYTFWYCAKQRSKSKHRF